MDWKTVWRRLYYETAPAPDDIVLDPKTTALLVIDIQNTYLQVPDVPAEAARWAPFFARVKDVAIPQTAALQA